MMQRSLINLLAALLHRLTNTPVIDMLPEGAQSVRTLIEAAPLHSRTLTIKATV